MDKTIITCLCTTLGCLYQYSYMHISVYIIDNDCYCNESYLTNIVCNASLAIADTY